MSVDVRPEIVIARPRAVVARYMFDPTNDMRWTQGVVAVKPLSEGLLRKGSGVERTSKFMGRTFSYVVEVVAHEDERFVEMKVTEPFPMTIRYELEDAPGGTRVAIHARGDATGFFKLAGPLMAPMVKSSIGKDLLALKRAVEAQSAPPSSSA
jgi:hypothetical protein